jgi:hypothetical protein
MGCVWCKLHNRNSIKHSESIFKRLPSLSDDIVHIFSEVLAITQWVMVFRIFSQKCYHHSVMYIFSEGWHHSVTIFRIISHCLLALLTNQGLSDLCCLWFGPTFLRTVHSSVVIVNYEFEVEGLKVPFGNFIDLCNFCSVPHFLRSAH